MNAGNQSFTQGFNNGPSVGSQKRRIKQMRRENGWDSYIKPISKFNTQVHASAKIGFERI
jgi:hypothetical protein